MTAGLERQLPTSSAWLRGPPLAGPIAQTRAAMPSTPPPAPPPTRASPVLARSAASWAVEFDVEGLSECLARVDDAELRAELAQLLAMKASAVRCRAS